MRPQPPIRHDHLAPLLRIAGGRIAVSNPHKNTLRGKALYSHYDERSGLMASLNADDVFRDHYQDSLLKVKSLLATDRGLRTFKSGLKGGVHIVKAEGAEGIANSRRLQYWDDDEWCEFMKELLYVFLVMQLHVD